MEQNRNQQNKPPQGNDKRPKNSIWVTLIITVAIILIISSVLNMIRGSQYTETTFTDFRQAMEDNNLAEVEIRYDRIIYLTKEEAAKPAAKQKACYTGLPNGDVLALADQLHAIGVEKVYAPIVEDNSMIIMILYYVIMFAVFFLVVRTLT